MKVSKSQIFEGRKAFTAITVDDDVPNTGWHEIRIGGKAFIPDVALGANRVLLLIEGRHDFSGMEIVFE